MSRSPQPMRVSARKRVQIAAQRAVQNVEELGALHNELGRRFEEFVDQVGEDHAELGRRVTRLQVAEDALAKTLQRLQLDLNHRHEADLALRGRPLWRRVLDWFKAPVAPAAPLQVAELYEAICEQQYFDLVVLPRAAGAIGEGLQCLAEPVAAALSLTEDAGGPAPDAAESVGAAEDLQASGRREALT